MSDAVQTFLPYPGARESARVLDHRRLGKQRVEAKQILSCLLGTGSLRWANHPAVRMWRGYEFALCVYGTIICDEWIARGYRDNVQPWFAETRISLALGASSSAQREVPPWMGIPAFHASHRSNLLRKDPKFYGQYEWTEPPDMSYVWPV